MVMEASRAEYLAKYSLKQQLDRRDNSTPGAEPSSSGASMYSLIVLLAILDSSVRLKLLWSFQWEVKVYE